ncbi:MULTISPECIES: cytochrome c biogenesis protein ResB [unclassified Duganella]|uniref:cytochrome c biogenesis protein ResB n=1 Tax=unclassified Duganella TaxID=2636909 RepID=UPI000E35066D|nr:MULTISPECIES: cytochrome c biogenesis protein ResB [unclassified Duganella]RFP10168.1 cytochrome c biogenesis protein ResB [Duganella sp. BJB475]RFP25526.1 cytochrome c biogenesis protein ResB [Duganella sp. BJB476]
MSSSPSTTGIELKTRRPIVGEMVELISSMRFAIALLAMIAIAAIVGTVMKQGEATNNYINQFGPFWFEVFGKLGLYGVYSAWWFLLLMTALVTSTTLCIIRNAPKMLKDMRSWRENVRENSLLNFHHKMQWRSPLARAALAQQTAARLADTGYKVKLVDKDHGTLVAAKQGAANKFGYIFAHSAIVIICIGGLLDSDVPIRLQEWFLGKVPFNGSGLISAVPAQSRLGLGNPTFRGNTMIPEGQSSESAIITRPDGVLIQDLPFTIKLKKFTIDFYTTGMPKLFASEVEVRDHASGEVVKAVIEVNKPLLYQGLAIYQSSFDDGGSKLKLTGFPMVGSSTARFDIAGEVGGSTPMGDAYSVEWSGFRPFNVENLAATQDARAVTKGKSLEEQFANSLDKHTGSAGRNANNKDLKNVGPSVTYKLRDKTGQAREYQNYMQPVTVDGATVFLAGMRVNPSDQFSFLRIPADDAHSVTEWMRLRAALSDAGLRAAAARHYAERATPQSANGDALRGQLQASAEKSLTIFAGNDKAAGFVAISQFLEKIPGAEQEKAADVFMKILNGSLWDLWQAARAKDGLEPVSADENHARFLQLATNALSDAFFYGAPVYLQLDDFTQVQASVFQVTRSPGKKVVYLGCVFLVLGVFSMFYIRERRLWVWIKDDGNGAEALMAMSTQRKTLDFEREFETLKEKLPQSA